MTALCACGCGLPVAGCYTQTKPGLGQVAGQPHKFKRGHNNPKVAPTEPFDRWSKRFLALVNKQCVNPSHLFIGTPTDNTRDMVSKGRQRWDYDRHGAKNPNVKLTEQQVLSIRTRRAAGDTPAVLSQEFGITPNHVWRLANGHAWKQLDERRR